MKWWALLLQGYTMFMYFMQTQRSFLSNCSVHAKQLPEVNKIVFKEVYLMSSTMKFLFGCFCKWRRVIAGCWICLLAVYAICALLRLSLFCIIILKFPGQAWQFDYVSCVFWKYYLSSLLLECSILLVLLLLKWAVFPIKVCIELNIK